jgi:hypothetical protein
MRFQIPLFTLFLVSPLCAQLGKFQANFPGNTHKLDVQALLNNLAGTSTNQDFNLFVGIAQDRFGHYWATSQRSQFDHVKATPHRLWEFWYDTTTSTWKFNWYAQPAAVNANSAFGLRDLAYDGGNFLFAGAELAVTSRTVYAFDIVNKQWDAAKKWTVPPSASVFAARALAYDPNGDSGNGSLWVADFSSDILEIRRNGTLIRSFPTIVGSFLGAGYDPVRKTVWWFSQLDPKIPSQGAVGIEMDTATGKDTGNRFLGDPSIIFMDPTGPITGGLAGGCEFVMKNGVPTLLLLSQAVSDTIEEIHGRFRYGTTGGPILSMAGNYPFHGTVWNMECTNLPANTFAGVLFQGTGKANISLPSFLFTPGSKVLLANARTVRRETPSGGKLTFAYTIPNDTALIQMPHYFQAMTLRVQGFFLRVSMSNGGQTVVY